MEYFWGIDFGGTKIECAVIRDMESLQILARERVSTDNHLGYEHMINQVALLIDIVSDKIGTRPKRIGMCTPGTTEPATGFMKNSNATGLNGKPFNRDLELKLGIPVMMANDANCFALAEARLGAAKEHGGSDGVVFGIIMGSGVGGGLVLNGRVWNGLHGIGGEWGHSILEENGYPCYCGLNGCVEQVISGPALERYYKSLSGHDLKLKEIWEAHQSGLDEFADRTVDRLLEYYGRATAQLINILDPNAIVIGGGVGNLDCLYTEGRERILKYLFNGELKTPILKPRLGDSAGVFGAALL